MSPGRGVTLSLALNEDRHREGLKLLQLLTCRRACRRSSETWLSYSASAASTASSYAAGYCSSPLASSTGEGIGTFSGSGSSSSGACDRAGDDQVSVQVCAGPTRQTLPPNGCVDTERHLSCANSGLHTEAREHAGDASERRCGRANFVSLVHLHRWAAQCLWMQQACPI